MRDSALLKDILRLIANYGLALLLKLPLRLLCTCPLQLLLGFCIFIHRALVPHRVKQACKHVLGILHALHPGRTRFLHLVASTF